MTLGRSRKAKARKAHKTLVESNREHDLYLYESGNIYFIPQGWCDEFDNPEQPDELPNGPEIYCYAPISTVADSEVETLWVPIIQLSIMSERTEAEAKKIHPKLFVYLDAINKGLV